MSSFKYHRTVYSTALAASVLLVCASAGWATHTPTQLCQAGRNHAAGLYAACRQNAEATLILSGDATKYVTTLAKCQTKFAHIWQKLADTATKAGATCPDLFNEGDFEAVINAHSVNIATALAGGELQDCPGQLDVCQTSLGLCDFRLTGALACGNAVIDAGEDCDQGNLNGETCLTEGFTDGTLTCGAGCRFDTTGCS